ncbi:MAG: CoA transferase [Limnohabitans sp.]|nr:CoA transferase [Limnohabitans sp.]
MAEQASASALGRFKVLDLTRIRSGPTCVRVLADFGADVIRIESPAGLDPNEGALGGRDTYDMLNLHRNKRSLTLNLKTQEGRDIFYKLVRASDVVVENYRPDVKDRLGIDYNTVSQINPKIILASISGFGQDGPYQARPGFDQIAQGMGGLMSVTGIPGQGPVRAGIAVADSGAGVYAAVGVLVALLERERSGRGQWVQSSLLQSMIALCDFQAARYLIDGEIPPQAGNDHPFATPMGTFQSSDGYFNIGASGTTQYRSLCEVIGRLDLRDEPCYQINSGRLKDRTFLNDELNHAFAKRTTDEWVEALNDAGVPCGPIYNMKEVFDDPQVKHLDMTATLQHPRRGKIRVVKQPLVLSRTPAKVETTQAELGENNQDILAELGYSLEQMNELEQKKVI